MIQHLELLALTAGIAVVPAGVGAIVGGATGALVAAGVAAALVAGAWAACVRVPLRLYGAEVLDPWSAPELHAAVRRLSHAAGLPAVPRVALAPHPQPNAFVVGRGPRSAVVCVIRGLLDRLPSPEASAALAHELARVERRDVLVRSVAATLAAALSGEARLRPTGHATRAPGPIRRVLAAPAAALLRLAFSPGRELGADEGAARIVEDAAAVADALEFLESAARSAPMGVGPAAAALVPVDPRGGSGDGGTGWLATRPPTGERVLRLRGMAAGDIADAGPGPSPGGPGSPRPRVAGAA